MIIVNELILLLLSIIILLFGIVSIFFFFLKNKKRKNVLKTNENSQQQIENIKYIIPVIKEYDHVLYEKFIKKYDDGSLKFNSIPFRKGARITCQFGISEGFRYINSKTGEEWKEKDGLAVRKMEWGYVRVHTGVDRAGGSDYTMKDGTVIKDAVRCPFDFNRTSFIDYGGISYGSLIRLFNDEYQFEFRIAHMNPKKDILPWSLEQFKKNAPFYQGYILGSAGNYGDSSGAHTHTEVVSTDESSEVLEILLEQLYGDKVVKEYSEVEIVKEYQKYSKFKTASKTIILKDWQEWKKSRKILFANKYLYRYIDPETQKVKTRYSSELLFNGL